MRGRFPFDEKFWLNFWDFSYISKRKGQSCEAYQSFLKFSPEISVLFCFFLQNFRNGWLNALIQSEIQKCQPNYLFPRNFPSIRPCSRFSEFFGLIETPLGLVLLISFPYTIETILCYHAFCIIAFGNDGYHFRSSLGLADKV